LASAGKAVSDGKTNGSAGAIAVAKPSGFDLNKFKSKRADAIAKVDTLQTGLPIHNISQAKDFVRLHPDEENYWSPDRTRRTAGHGSKADAGARRSLAARSAQPRIELINPNRTAR
jgi:hypothetical protein